MRVASLAILSLSDDLAEPVGYPVEASGSYYPVPPSYTLILNFEDRYPLQFAQRIAVATKEVSNSRASSILLY